MSTVVFTELDAPPVGFVFTELEDPLVGFVFTELDVPPLGIIFTELDATLGFVFTELDAPSLKIIFSELDGVSFENFIISFSNRCCFSSMLLKFSLCSVLFSFYSMCAVNDVISLKYCTQYLLLYCT
jgi:hypothetical protein